MRTRKQETTKNIHRERWACDQKSTPDRREKELVFFAREDFGDGNRED